MIESSDMLFHLVAFMVPGFLWYRTSRAFFVSSESGDLPSTIRFLLFALINYALWFLQVRFLLDENYYSANPLGAFALWVVIIIISPVVLGAIHGFIQQRDLVRFALAQVGVFPLESSPTAWHFLFSRLSRTKGGEWIVVTLKDGKQIFGHFGSNSSASSGPTEHDIYIETVVGTEPEFTPDDSYTIGVYVPFEQIAHIQIRRKTENGKTDNPQTATTETAAFEAGAAKSPRT